MERRKYTTTLTPETIRNLNIIKSIEEMNGTNDVIEKLVREYISEKGLEGLLNEINKAE